MTNGINGEGDVPQQNCVDEKRPDDELRSVCAGPRKEPSNGYSEGEESERGSKDRYPRIAVQPTQLRVNGEICHIIQMGGIRVAAGEPSMMSDTEPLNSG